MRPGCQRHYRSETFRRYTRARYTRRSVPLTAGQKLHIKHLALCLANKRKSHRAYATKRRLRARFRARLAYYRLTPYGPCYGGRWAVPCEIIGGESGGYWGAENPYGCVGPYQFCGWSVPWPADSEADRVAHHRMAAYLWKGGAGCSNWEQTSSAC